MKNEEGVTKEEQQSAAYERLHLVLPQESLLLCDGYVEATGDEDSEAIGGEAGPLGK